MKSKTDSAIVNIAHIVQFVNRVNATSPGCVRNFVQSALDGHIVAERYAPGYGPETLQIGWSVTEIDDTYSLGELGFLGENPGRRIDGPDGTKQEQA